MQMQGSLGAPSQDGGQQQQMQSAYPQTFSQSPTQYNGGQYSTNMQQPMQQQLQQPMQQPVQSGGQASSYAEMGYPQQQIQQSQPAQQSPLIQQGATPVGANGNSMGMEAPAIPRPSTGLVPTMGQSVKAVLNTPCKRRILPRGRAKVSSMLLPSLF